VTTSSAWAQYVAEDLLSRQYASYFTDVRLANRNGNTANGLIDLNATSDVTSDGVCRVLPDQSLICTNNLGVNPVPVATDLYVVYWNIVDDRPLDSVKQIHIIVRKNSGPNSGQLYTQDYFKSILF